MKNTELIIKPEICSNLNMRVFHVNTKISESNNFTINTFKVNDRDFKNKVADMGILGVKLAELIINIEGITEVYVDAYKIRIEKAILYSWDDLQPIIMNIIEIVIRSNHIILALNSKYFSPDSGCKGCNNAVDDSILLKLFETFNQ